MAPESDQIERGARFSRLFATHQRRIFAFILSLVPRKADADEVFQDTSEVLWRKFDEFDDSRPGSDFGSWAVGVARFKVLEHLRQRGRAVLSLSDADLSVLADEAASAGSELESQLSELAHCVDRLPPNSHRILQMRYAEQMSAPRIADQLGVTHQAIYKSMKRIHNALLECMQGGGIASDVAGPEPGRGPSS